MTITAWLLQSQLLKKVAFLQLVNVKAHRQERFTQKQEVLALHTIFLIYENH